MPVEILFCDRCHESIPDADLENGRAVRVGGRVLHVPCAFRRAMPGPGGVLTFLLALVAAAGVAFLLVRHFTDESTSASPASAPAARADVDAAIERLRADVRESEVAGRKSLSDALDDAVKRLDASVAAKIAADHDALVSLKTSVQHDRDSMQRRVEAS